MRIIPSILETTQEAFIDAYKNVNDVATHFQIDIADGVYVDNKTISTRDVLESLSFFMTQGKSFEFHLMCDNPRSDLDLLSTSTITISKIYIHTHGLSTITLDETFSIGVAINPEEEVAQLLPTIGKSTNIQIMTIQPGRQGNPFISSQLKKISQLKSLGYTGSISLDGGIGIEEARDIASLTDKPDEIIVGSFLKENPRKHIAVLQQILS